MKSHRFGCLSATGIITAILTLVLIAGFMLTQGGVLFSPGKLNAEKGEQAWGGVRSHAEISGECAACHAPPWGRETMRDRCISCHINIAEELQSTESLHSVLFTENTAFTCKDCHPDHRGADSKLTLLDLNRFPHQATGFALNAHQKTRYGEPFSCEDCHGENIIKFDMNTCEKCHREIDQVFTQAHQETFSKECLACHDGVDIYSGDFDHNQLTFPLEGEHASLTCSKCHLGNSSIKELQDTPQECYACHYEDDEHNGEFGESCAVCHTPSDWEDATFDHSLSGFPLEGKHIDMECEDCHKNDIYEGTSSACVDCHLEDDEHKGEFGVACEQCHTSINWEDVTFDHALSNFPLDGAHITVACQDCHIDQVYQGTKTECAACHEDPAYHAGVFSADCITCHTTDAWSPATYNDPHTFPMNHESSGDNSCRTCHDISFDVYTCYGCHEHTPSNIASEHREEGISNYENCMECHPDGREPDDDD